MKLPKAVLIERQPAIWLLLAVATVAGCRSVDNAQVDLLERELRQQEDYIYELEDYLVEYSEKLRRCRCASDPHHRRSASSSATAKPEIPEPELADDSPAESEDLGPVPELADEPLPEPTPADSGLDGIPQRVDETPLEPDSIDIENLDELDVPDLEIGPNPSGQTTPQLDGEIELAGAENQLVIPDPLEYVDEEMPAMQLPAAPVAQTAQTAEPAARQTPDRVVIRQIMADDPPSPDEPSGGLLVVVELQNHLGEPLEIDGTTSVMVLTRDEPQRRVARWDFEADEAAAAWQSSILGDGLHLLLPVEAGSLGADQYELWSRVVTADGEKLLAKALFQPGELATLAEAEASLLNDQDEGVALAEAPEPTAPPTVAQAPGDGAWKASDEPIVRAADLRSAPRTGGASWTRSTHQERFDPPPADRRETARRRQSAERWTPFQ